jgi:hypothetical protein
MSPSRLFAALGLLPACSSLVCGPGTLEADGVCVVDPEALRTHTFAKVSAGDRHTCGLDIDGTITCWGRNDDGQASAPDGLWADVETGRTHSCALDEEGMPTCWGYPLEGVLDVPQRPFEALDLGWSTGCGLDADGVVTCWGQGIASPPDDVPLRKVTVGFQHLCGLTLDDEARCWARGGGAVDADLVPPPGRWKDLDAGNGFSCGVDLSGVLSCWGQDEDGRVSEAPEGGLWESVVAGHTHACALDTENRLACWGALPSPEEDWREITETRGDWTGVSAGKGFHACGAWANGKVLCWGSNDNGQIDVPCINPLDTWSGQGHLAR